MTGSDRGEVLLRGRAGRLFMVLGGLGLGAAIFAWTFGLDSDPGSAAADSFSRSAIGHGALVELLRRDPERQVVVSRFRSADRLASGRALLLLEPPSEPRALEELAEMVTVAVERGAAVVVVLPKWRGREGGRPGWVESVDLRAESRPRQVLETVVEALGGAAEGAALERRRAAQPLWSGSADGHRVSLPWPQLVRGAGPWDRVWGSGEGELLLALDSENGSGQVSAQESGAVWILTDPDLVNNAGLGRADNAAAFVGLLDRLGASALVIDETLHGYERRPTPWRALLEMPLLPVTLHAALLLALALWASTARFGRPLAAPSRLAPGKLTLVENTAELLGLGDHRREALRRYLALTVRSAAASLGLPPGSDAALIQRLDRLAESRGSSRRLAPLARAAAALPERPEAARALELARRLHAFRKELTDDDRRF